MVPGQTGIIRNKLFALRRHIGGQVAKLAGNILISLIHSDGRTYYEEAGKGVVLKPGMSVTLWPHQFHNFETVPGTGDILIGEVSRCNDDNTDNIFHDKVGRFPAIEEDEPAYRLLCNEYPPAAD